MPKTIEQLDRELQEFRTTVKQALESFQVQINQQVKILQQLAALVERLSVEPKDADPGAK